MTFEILPHWKKVCDIQTWYIIWLGETIRPSTAIYHSQNLSLISTRNFDLEDVHVEGAERIAEAVAKYDIDRFIHVSSFNANKDSTSEFFRTKV